MKAIIKSTGETKDLTRIKEEWWQDEEGTAYHINEFISDEKELVEEDSKRFIESVIQVANDRYWCDKRFQLVLKLIDIYQVPRENMREILALADQYIERLKQYDR